MIEPHLPGLSRPHPAAFEAGDEAALAGAGGDSLNALLDHYLKCIPAGCWIDQLDANLAPSVQRFPSTIFYHIFPAFSELARLRAPISRSAG